MIWKATLLHQSENSLTTVSVRCSQFPEFLPRTLTHARGADESLDEYSGSDGDETAHFGTEITGSDGPVTVGWKIGGRLSF